MKLKLFALILVFISSFAFADFHNYCTHPYTYKNGKQQYCKYNPSQAVDFALKNYSDSTQSNSPFGMYGETNCTNFVSQVLLAGLLQNNSMNNIYEKRVLFEDKNELYKWFFNDKYNKSESWAGANGLYKYAKTNKEKEAPFKYSGFMFEFITRDYISSFDEKGNRRPNGGALEVNKIKPGDIIFVDYAKNGKHYKEFIKEKIPKNQIKTDGTMEHAFVVTKVDNQYFKDEATRYSNIYVTSSTETYVNHTLHYRNKLNDYAIEFHVYRPIGFVKN